LGDQAGAHDLPVLVISSATSPVVAFMITTSVPRAEMRVAAIQRPSGLIAGCTSPFSPMRVVLFLAML
jgi:hypothetical protein